MPFQISFMEEKDIPDFCAVDEAAMAEWPFAQALQQPSFSRREIAEYWTRMGWCQNQTNHWLKVIDTETGEMAGAAWWQFHLQSEKPERAEEASQRDDKNEGEESGRRVPEFPKLWMEAGRRWKAFKDEFIGDKQHAVLSLLITQPRYQRRGIGSMLVKWGCDKADELNIISALQASEAGYNVYTKHGFEIVKTSEFDLRPFGVEATELRRGMIRQPKPLVG